MPAVALASEKCSSTSPQSRHSLTPDWFPALSVSALGPDLSFSSASIFITSRVPRSYQGSAGALLITFQNLSSAIITSLSETIGVNYENKGPDAELSLEALKVCWWFNLACCLSAVLVVGFVRIPKTTEEEHNE